MLQDEGLRGLWGRGLATIAYRRVTVLVKEGGSAERRAPGGLEIRQIGPSDIREYRRLRPDVPTAELRRRLGTGQVCVLATLEGELVACRWYSLGRAEIPYLGFAFELPSDLAYVHEAFTIERARGRGLNRALRARGEALVQELGARRFMAAVMNENGPGMALTLSAGFTPAGRLAVVRLPGRRLLLRSRGLPKLGPAKPLPVRWSIAPPDATPATVRAPSHARSAPSWP